VPTGKSDDIWPKRGESKKSRAGNWSVLERIGNCPRSKTLQNAPVIRQQRTSGK